MAGGPTARLKRECIVPKETAKLWQIRSGLVAAGIIFLIIRFCFFTILALIPLTLTACISVILIFWYLPLYFRNLRVFYDESGFELQKGVFFKATYIMPFPRLIYVSSFSSPIARKWGLSGAVLRATRGFVIIPEIRKEDMLKILKISAGKGL